MIMNPPFTSNTAKEASHIGTFAPAFAAFESADQDQREMAKHLSKLKAGSCYHGHAGMASAFAALAHRKLKAGGILALVLPLTASAASSWRSFRKMLGQSYTGLTILSIAASDNDDLSFSSDTGMAECLVVACKAKPNMDSRQRMRFVSLSRRPQGFAHASALATNIENSAPPRQIDDGPYGGTSLMNGDDLAGEMLTSPHRTNGEVWGAVRISDYSVAQTAHALAQSKLWLPAADSSRTLNVAPLADMGSLGSMTWISPENHLKGLFTRARYRATATYPSLWNHDAKRETRIVCTPDSELLVRPGMEAKAAIVWATASRAHINRDFRFNSQPLSAAFTDGASIGGTAWPNVIFAVDRFNYAFSVWCNSTLGLLSHWWHSAVSKAAEGGHQSALRIRYRCWTSVLSPTTN